MAAEFFDKVKNISLLALGAIILGVHVLIFKLNQYMFTIIMCLYIIGYTVLMIVLLYKNKQCYNQSDFDTAVNMSAYTLFLEVFLILLTAGFMFYRSSSMRRY